MRLIREIHLGEGFSDVNTERQLVRRRKDLSRLEGELEALTINKGLKREINILFLSFTV